MSRGTTGFGERQSDSRQYRAESSSVLIMRLDGTNLAGGTSSLCRGDARWDSRVPQRKGSHHVVIGQIPVADDGIEGCCHD